MGDGQIKQRKENTARTCDHLICKDCGWPVVFACCNDSFVEFKDAGDWDWWEYCSNKGCKNHDGEGVFQEELDWVERIEEKK